MSPARLALAAVLVLATTGRADEPAWTRAADQKPPMTAAEARAFMKRLAGYVVEHHLKTDARSPQRGMVYEYFWVAQKGTPRQWVQGEALDTMHDGAWLACALVNAYRATGDPYYKDVLTRWQLPFYLKMLNDGDALFTSERDDSRPEARKIWTENKEHRLQGREKGFVPYWWDDGASVSLERLRDRKPGPVFPARDELAGKDNPEQRLSGYSLGSSNHLAQDLGAMLQVAWLLLKDSDADADKQLAAAVARAARHLQECRTRHGSGGIPAVLAADGLANRDAAVLRRIGEETWKSATAAKNHYRSAVVRPEPGRRYPTPGFADDQQYRYYAGLARNGTLTEPSAWRTVYDALTEPMLYDAYCDDAPRPPGVNRFDLYPLYFRDGQPEHRRSERKGPFKGPVPVGSRMGPQNMVCCGWALQALKAFPGVWDRGVAAAGAETLGLGAKVPSADAVRRRLERELGGGLRTWEAVFDAYGYIPTGIGCQTILGQTRWDAFSDSGGYAHLLSAAAQWVLYLEGKRDWEVQRVPRVLP